MKKNSQKKKQSKLTKRYSEKKVRNKRSNFEMLLSDLEFKIKQFCTQKKKQNLKKIKQCQSIHQVGVALKDKINE